MKTAEVCRRHGISGATICAWKAKFGGMEPSEVKRLKAIEDGNARLKRLLAEAMLDIEPLSAIGTRTMARGAEGSAVKKGDARRQARGRRASRTGLRDERGWSAKQTVQWTVCSEQRRVP